VAMNDYAFFPNCQLTNVTTGPGSFQLYQEADTSTTVGRFRLATTADANDTYVIRWRYVTASDMPEIYIARHNLTGAIHGVWASDDPPGDGFQGLTVDGCTTVRMTATDLEQLSALSDKASEAEAYILDNKLRLQHLAYRSLQLTAGRMATSQWIYQNCVLDVNGKLATKS
jgi:hypothetical protein